MERANLVITEEGLSKIARATIEEPLIIEKFGVGDGNGEEVELDASRTSLVNEKYRDYVNNKYTNDNNIVVECVLRGNAPIEEGFYLREIGLFDEEGILIAHAKLPEQYRPPYEEGQIVTEDIFNINLRIENSESIQVNIQETIFATVDDLQRLRERVEAVEANIESSVGVDKWFNTNNKYKDQDIVQIGVKTWGLAGSIVKIADYPQAFKNCGAVDKGDGTFEIPRMYNGTIRHLEKGDNRELGSFEDDAMQIIKGAFWDIIFQDLGNNGATGTSGPFFPKPFTPGNGRFAPSTAKNLDSLDGIGFDTSLVVKTDEKETRMKNTSGQWYMLLKVEF